MRIKKRLFAHAIACEKKRSIILIPDRESEHPAQQFQKVSTVLVVEMNDGFGIGFCIELVAALFKVVSQLAVVIYLAVKNDPLSLVGVVDRLFAAGEVNDRQPSHGESNVLIDVKSVFVRPAVNDSMVHRFEDRAVDRAAIGIYKSGDSAHL